VVVVMHATAENAEIDAVVARVVEAGGEAFVSRGESRTIIGLIGDLEQFADLQLAGMPGVAETVRISTPFKLVSRDHHPDRSTVWVGQGEYRVPVGPGVLSVMAGPCAVETPEQTLESAQLAQALGATILRGGAYKPRTSPYAFQGLGKSGLQILSEVRAETGLPIVTEVVDPADVAVVAEYSDMLQIGTRNMANFGLLQAAGSAGKPVLLKRGMSATIEEWLMAAEYIAQRGNPGCVRGPRCPKVVPSTSSHRPQSLWRQTRVGATAISGGGGSGGRRVVD